MKTKNIQNQDRKALLQKIVEKLEKTKWKFEKKDDPDIDPSMELILVNSRNHGLEQAIAIIKKEMEE